MTTARAYFEIYKALPKKVKKELKTLIDEEYSIEDPLLRRVELIEKAETIFTEFRKGLPADYEFNRDVANER